MKITRRLDICAGAIEKRPIEEFDPPLDKEERQFYEWDYEWARYREKLGFDPNELKNGVLYLYFSLDDMIKTMQAK